MNDVSFIPVFAHSLEHTGGYTPEAARVAKTLLPDVLQFDPRLPASYPTNGRALTDDVIDVFFPLLTNGKIIRDDVGPDTDLIVEFPYLGQPQKVRSASVNAGTG